MEHMIRNYLLKREQLMYVCQLIDSRVSPQKNDLDFIGWMGKNHIPFVIIFTKLISPATAKPRLISAILRKQCLQTGRTSYHVCQFSRKKTMARRISYNFLIIK